MKKLVLCFILLLAILIPLACGNQNNAPSSPINGGGATATRTPTTVASPGSPTSTPTSSGSTATPIPTFATQTPAVYSSLNVASAAPNGLYVDTSSAPVSLYVAEGEPGVTMLEQYAISPGSLTGGLYTNQVVIGYPTPQVPAPTPTIPVWSGVTITLAGPQAFVYNNGNGGSVATLDSTAGGAATLYTGNVSWWTGTQYGTNLQPVTCNGYDALSFNNPKGMAIDSGASTIYVADTGNGRVDALAAQGNPQFPNAWIHYWTTLYGTSSPSGTPFKSPYAITLDSSNNIWVSDTGYTPAVIEAYNSGGATVLNSPLYTISGCVPTGIAVSISGAVTNVYVADSGNNEVEVYNANGTGGSIVSAFTIGTGNGYLSKQFHPYSVAISGANIIVGDTSNDKIITFVQH